MAETEDIQPLVCDNGTGMVKVTLMIEQTKNSFYQHLVNVQMPKF